MIKVFKPRSTLSLAEVNLNVYRMKDLKSLFVNLQDHNSEISVAFNRGCEHKQLDYLAAKEAHAARCDKIIKEIQDENNRLRKELRSMCDRQFHKLED